jgi:hypothetical protein
MVLLRLILLFLLFYVLISFIGRLLFPRSHSRQSFSKDNKEKRQSKRKEGEVHINYKPGKKEKLIRKDEGEYIRYEEIKDD